MKLPYTIGHYNGGKTAYFDRPPIFLHRPCICNVPAEYAPRVFRRVSGGFIPPPLHSPPGDCDGFRTIRRIVHSLARALLCPAGRNIFLHRPCIYNAPPVTRGGYRVTYQHAGSERKLLWLKCGCSTIAAGLMPVSIPGIRWRTASTVRRRQRSGRTIWCGEAETGIRPGLPVMRVLMRPNHRKRRRFCLPTH